MQRLNILCRPSEEVDNHQGGHSIEQAKVNFSCLEDKSGRPAASLCNGVIALSQRMCLYTPLLCIVYVINMPM